MAKTPPFTTLVVMAPISLPKTLLPSSTLTPTAKTPTTTSLITREMLSHYFKSLIVNSSAVGDSTPLLAHKDFVNKHLLLGFPTNPRVVSTLKLSLLKLCKSTNPQIGSSSVKVIYNKIALLLSDLGFAYRVNKEIRDSSTTDLHRLVELQSK